MRMLMFAFLLIGSIGLTGCSGNTSSDTVSEAPPESKKVVVSQPPPIPDRPTPAPPSMGGGAKTSP